MEENKTLIWILLSFDATLNGWSNFSLQQNISATELSSHLCKQHCLHTTAARIFKWIPELVPKSTNQTILIQKKMKHINPNLDADLHFSHTLLWPNKKQTFLVAAKTTVKAVLQEACSHQSLEVRLRISTVGNLLSLGAVLDLRQVAHGIFHGDGAIRCCTQAWDAVELEQGMHHVSTVGHFSLRSLFSIWPSLHVMIVAVIACHDSGHHISW